MRKPHPEPKIDDKWLARFMGRVPVASPDACWDWTGSINHKGYGEFSCDGRNHKAHRIAYYLATGKWPFGLFVCHSCDNPSCVNPDHLWLGTNRQNMEDKWVKGRGFGVGPNDKSARHKARPTVFMAFLRMIDVLNAIKSDPSNAVNLAEGALDYAGQVDLPRSRHGPGACKTKLTEEDVRDIRRLGGSTVNLARKYEVSPSAIKSVKSGRTWRHVQ